MLNIVTSIYLFLFNEWVCVSSPTTHPHPHTNIYTHNHILNQIQTTHYYLCYYLHSFNSNNSRTYIFVHLYYTQSIHILEHNPNTIYYLSYYIPSFLLPVANCCICTIIYTIYSYSWTKSTIQYNLYYNNPSFISISSHKRLHVRVQPVGVRRLRPLSVLEWRETGPVRPQTHAGRQAVAARYPDRWRPTTVQ